MKSASTSIPFPKAVAIALIPERGCGDRAGPGDAGSISLNNVARVLLTLLSFSDPSPVPL